VRSSGYLIWKDFSPNVLAFESTDTPTGANDVKEELQIMSIIGKV
jgi:hypothetical protein